MTWRLPVRVLVFEHAANTCTPHVGVPSRRYTDRRLHVVDGIPEKNGWTPRR